MVAHNLSQPFYHFPERVDVIGRLLALARGELPPSAILMPVETGGGKTRLMQFLSSEAGLSPGAVLGIHTLTYGPESIVNDLLKALGVERPRVDEDWGNGQIVSMPVELPIEKAMDVLENALRESGTKLILFDDAHNVLRQQSVPAKRWLQGFLRALVQRHRISIVLMTIPEYEQPTIPGTKMDHAFLGTVGDSNELRSWLDNVQDMNRALGSPSGRLTDPDVLPRLIAENYGMLGFIEGDAVSLLVGGLSTSPRGIPKALADRINHPECRREYIGRDDFRKRVYMNLRRAYDSQT